jgi:hypothetical protein
MTERLQSGMKQTDDITLIIDDEDARVGHGNQTDPILPLVAWINNLLQLTGKLGSYLKLT